MRIKQDVTLRWTVSAVPARLDDAESHIAAHPAALRGTPSCSSAHTHSASMAPYTT